MKRVEGKVAIVTGAASGIGKGCAAMLAAEGARVVLADRVPCEPLGEPHRVEQLDVTDEAAWARVVDATVAAYGRLDILVNAAGIAVWGDIERVTLKEWRLCNAVNSEGTFLGCQAAIRAMKLGGGGSIINISSLAGLKGSPTLAGYCATKGGVRLFTKAVALECAAARDNVRVNSVHPGVIETPIWLGILPGTIPGAGQPGANAPNLDVISETMVPTGKKGLPEDIAAGVLYLASDDSRYVTGSELVIDGGMSTR